jgi:hypothetical protein
VTAFNYSLTFGSWKLDAILLVSDRLKTEKGTVADDHGTPLKFEALDHREVDRSSRLQRRILPD